MSGPRRTGLIWKLDAAAFACLVAESQTLTEILAHFGMTMRGHNYRTLLKRAAEEDVDLSHLRNRRQLPPSNRRPLTEILVEGSSFGTDHLKRRLLAENMLRAQCAHCGLGNIWQDKPLVLHLDHINGNARDHRLENLRLLCPNCHSQTDTYSSKGRQTPSRLLSEPQATCPQCGFTRSCPAKDQLCRRCADKRRRKVNRPSQDVLLKQVTELGYTETGCLYGVSDNAIRKWLRANSDAAL